MLLLSFSVGQLRFHFWKGIATVLTAVSLSGEGWGEAWQFLQWTCSWTHWNFFYFFGCEPGPHGRKHRVLTTRPLGTKAPEQNFRRFGALFSTLPCPWLGSWPSEPCFSRILLPEFLALIFSEVPPIPPPLITNKFLSVIFHLLHRVGWRSISSSPCCIQGWVPSLFLAVSWKEVFLAKFEIVQHNFPLAGPLRSWVWSSAPPQTLWLSLNSLQVLLVPWRLKLPSGDNRLRQFNFVEHPE